MQQNKFNQNFDLKNATLNKRESNLLRRKIPKSATIKSYQNINLHPGFFQISLFMKEFLLSQVKMNDYKNVKN